MILQSPGVELIYVNEAPLSGSHAGASLVSSCGGGQMGRALTRGQRMTIWISTIGLVLLLLAGIYFAYGGIGVSTVLGALLLITLAIWIDRTA
jgi:hypothetical protein